MVSSLPAHAGCRRFDPLLFDRPSLSSFFPNLEVSNTHLMKSSVRISRGVESLFGTRDENIRLIEAGLGVHTQLVDNNLEIEGEPDDVTRAQNILEDYNTLLREGFVFNNGDLNSYLRVVTNDREVSLRALVNSGKQRSFGKKILAPKTVNQRRYLEAIERNDLVFGIGPAGTGKTYLAVAMAISALLNKQVARIILTRPAVEAGERLGFLPGTLQEKIDPYLRPLYDALYDMLDNERVEKLLERNVIEVAPIAFMRGRTLNDSFIILDEAQNCTPEQMKMVLTRLGFNSKMVVNGDVTQIDLPNARRSGLIEATDVLRGVEGITLRPVRRQGRRAPHPGAAHGQSLRAVQRSHRRRTPVLPETDGTARRERERRGQGGASPRRDRPAGLSSAMSSPEGSSVTFRRVPATLRRTTIERFARRLQKRSRRRRALRHADHRRRRTASPQSRLPQEGLRHRCTLLSLPGTSGDGLGDLAISARPRPRPGPRVRPHHRAGNPDPHAPRRASPAGPRPRNRPRPHGTPRKALARPAGPARRTHRAGEVMMLGILLGILITIPLLGLTTFVQVLYLESLRLRTRDLPSLKFFKETLEDKFGMKTEDGAGAFSLVKHTLLAMLGILYFAWFSDGTPWHAAVFWQAVLAVIVTMIAVSFALPQLLYRRTSAHWLLPFVPLLRLIALVTRPFVVMLAFFQSLIDLTDDTATANEEPTPAENIEALISAGTEEGLIEEEDRKLIQSVVEFGDKVVREVMTPRPNIVAIAADATLEQLRQLVITEQYSRIPVYEGTIDQCDRLRSRARHVRARGRGARKAHRPRPGSHHHAGAGDQAGQRPDAPACSRRTPTW